MIKHIQALPIAVFFLSFFLFSCKKNSPLLQGSVRMPADTIQPSAGPVETNAKLYLALGDSYTIGESIDSSGRYPAQTAALLELQGVHLSGIRYIATTGWTTVNLFSAIESQNPKGPFEVVSLLIGVNDQYRSQDTSGYSNNFERDLLKAIELASGIASHVFVLSIPDYGVTPFGKNYIGTSEQIDQYNAINEKITNRYGISYTDITAISRKDGSDPSMLAYDGLHPSQKQYAQWAKALAPAMYKILH